MSLSLKRIAAEKAVEYIQSGQVIGLGTGSTVNYAIAKIGKLIREGALKDILAIPTSKQTEKLAKEEGIPLTTLEEHPVIDLTIDGADEVDPLLNLIKGLGGALLREKIVAKASKQEIIVVDDSKLVEALGTKAPLPVEVLPFAWKLLEKELAKLDCKPMLRLKDGERFLTDQGNYIFDCYFSSIKDPYALEQKLNDIPGAIEHGLFLDLADMVIVASAAGVKILKR